MEATDNFAASQVSITILDENDNSPVFDITSDTSVSIPENTAMGKKVAVVLAKDSDAGLNGLVRLYFSTSTSHTSDSEFGTARHFWCTMNKLNMQSSKAKISISTCTSIFFLTLKTF